jgi:hypothetical protein
MSFSDQPFSLNISTIHPVDFLLPIYQILRPNFHISYFAAIFKMTASRINKNKISQKNGKGKEKSPDRGGGGYIKGV